MSSGVGQRSRSRWPSVLALAAAVVLAPGGAEQAKPASPMAQREPPSIVLILTDDQRWDTLWGMRTVGEALADHGVTFTNSFVVNRFAARAVRAS